MPTSITLPDSAQNARWITRDAKIAWCPCERKRERKRDDEALLPSFYRAIRRNETGMRLSIGSFARDERAMLLTKVFYSTRVRFFDLSCWI